MCTKKIKIKIKIKREMELSWMLCLVFTAEKTLILSHLLKRHMNMYELRTMISHDN